MADSSTSGESSDSSSDSSDSETEGRVSKQSRLQCVQQGVSEAVTQEEMAKAYGVTSRTIRNDIKELGLGVYSDISNGELLLLVQQVVREESHDKIGEPQMHGRLIKKGHRVQRARIRMCMHAIGQIQPRPKKTWRPLYYETKGPDYIWSVDQNEKLGQYGMKLLSCIDGWSRYPVHFVLVQQLRAIDHVRFFGKCIGAARMVPARVTLDRGPWFGVKVAMSVFYGDPDECDQIDVEGEVIKVKRFQECKSVHNTPVEGHWREVNKITKKWRLLFRKLDQDGILSGGKAWKDNANPNGKKADPLDLFCAWEIFGPLVRRDLYNFYNASRVMKKRKSTKNPDYPDGTVPKSWLYRGKRRSYGSRFSAAAVEAAMAAGEASCADTADGPFTKDPLAGKPGAQAIRGAAVAALGTGASPVEKYKTYRAMTIQYK